MSILSVILRCDHLDCNETTDQLAAAPNWRRNEVPLFGRVLITLDYCPAHEAEHAFAVVEEVTT